MAEEFGMFHDFISAIPDDPTFVGTVQPQSHWNQYHVMKGGNPGDLAVRDVTVPQGFSWQAVNSVVSGRLLNYAAGIDTILNNPSPTRDTVPVTFTVQKANSRVVIVTYAQCTDSGTAIYRNMALFTFLDNVAFNSTAISAMFTPTLLFGVRAPEVGNALSVGTHSLFGRFTTNFPGVTTAVLAFYVLEFG